MVALDKGPDEAPRPPSPRQSALEKAPQAIGELKDLGFDYTLVESPRPAPRKMTETPRPPSAHVSADDPRYRFDQTLPGS